MFYRQNLYSFFFKNPITQRVFFFCVSVELSHGIIACYGTEIQQYPTFLLSQCRGIVVQINQWKIEEFVGDNSVKRIIRFGVNDIIFRIFFIFLIVEIKYGVDIRLSIFKTEIIKCVIDFRRILINFGICAIHNVGGSIDIKTHTSFIIVKFIDIIKFTVNLALLYLVKNLFHIH